MTSSPRSLLPWAALALALVALTPLVGCSRPSPPRDRILFDHGPHLARGAGCSDCHAGAGVARGDSDPSVPAASDAPDAGTEELAEWMRIPHPRAGERPLLPTEAGCRTCHDDAERDRCATCHREPASPGSYDPPDTDIHFDHAQHEEPGAGQCVHCHAGSASTVARYEPGRPTMDTCTSGCHQEDMRELRCAPCHGDLHRYQIDDISLLDHGPGFLRNHGVSARADMSLCTQCHDPTFCEDCHLSSPGLPLEMIEPTAVYRDFVHRGDFLSRHMVEAGLERGTCARCHGVSFCDDCHRESGVGGGVGSSSPHPPGWLDPLSSFGHARAARRDLLSCVSCHEADAETTCVPCHRVGGVAGNPHPPGFGGGMDPMVHGVCRACHVMR